MRSIIFCLMSFFFGLFIATSYAWDSTGHRLVAAIAYARLTPVVKRKINQLTAIMFEEKSPEKRFFHAAVWPDTLKEQGITQYDSWHYINLPYVKGNVRPQPVNKQNVVYAIELANKIVKATRANLQVRAIFLSFLVHLVGDAHQPLHCIQLYSNQFPYGDAGGNLFPIHSIYADNLHSLWDQGVGLFHVAGVSYPLNYNQVLLLAKKITKKYPKSYFKQRVKNLYPVAWVRRSYQLAKRYAYDIKPGAKPSRAYIKQGQKIVEQQIAIAGYQLAGLLNKELRTANIQQTKLNIYEYSQIRTLINNLEKRQ